MESIRTDFFFCNLISLQDLFWWTKKEIHEVKKAFSSFTVLNVFTMYFIIFIMINIQHPSHIKLKELAECQVEGKIGEWLNEAISFPQNEKCWSHQFFQSSDLWVMYKEHCMLGPIKLIRLRVTVSWIASSLVMRLVDTTVSQSQNCSPWNRDT